MASSDVSLADALAMATSYGQAVMVDRVAPTRERFARLARTRHGWTQAQFDAWAARRTWTVT